MEDAKRIVRDLFDRYNSEAGAPCWTDWRETFLKLDTRGRARLVCDYLAGQTNRCAAPSTGDCLRQRPILR